MKFPGSKLLHQWDLSAQALSLEELLRSCQKAGLTGMAELNLPGGVGLILYYLGGEVNAHFRDDKAAYSGDAALEQLRSRVEAKEGQVSVYELPLDMAHLLRGVTNRKKLRETLRGRSELLELLHRLEKAEHTGTLELQTPAGAGMILLVRGRPSNTYWEASDGPTFEKGEARQKLEQALEVSEALGFVSEFSRDVWKTRHAVPGPTRSRLERRDELAVLPTDQIASEERHLRRQVLEELAAELPGLLQAVMFDLLTGTVLVRTGRGAGDVRVGALAEQLPRLTLEIRDRLLGGEEVNALDHILLSTAQASILVVVIPEAQEAIGVVADRAQPAPLVGAALTRAARAYAEQILTPPGRAAARRGD